MADQWRFVAVASFIFTGIKAALGWTRSNLKFNSQGFANLLQLVTIGLAVWSFKVYFLPEQQLKRTQDKQESAEAARDLAERERVQAVQAKKRADEAVEVANGRVSELSEQVQQLSSNVVALQRMRDAAQQERDAANDQKNAITVDRDRAMSQLRQARASLSELAATRHAAEGELAAARSSLVRTREQIRPRAISLLPGLIATICGFDLEGRLTKCLASTIDAELGGVSDSLTRRDKQEALNSLRPYEAEYQKLLRQRSEAMRQRTRKRSADCEVIPDEEAKSRCSTEAILANASDERSTLGYFQVSEVLIGVLKPWAEALSRSSPCPRLGAGRLVPSDWPADCV